MNACYTRDTRYIRVYSVCFQALPVVLGVDTGRGMGGGVATPGRESKVVCVFPIVVPFHGIIPSKYSPRENQLSDNDWKTDFRGLSFLLSSSIFILINTAVQFS